jgi:hypothetical protein
MTTLQDIGVATFEAISDGLRQLVAFFSSAFPQLSTFMQNVFGDVEFSIQGVLQVTARTVDGIVGFFKGGANAIGVAFENLPATLELIFVNMFNSVSRLFTGFLNSIIEQINRVRTRLGQSAIDLLQPFQLEASRQSVEIGERINEEIANGIKNQTGAQDALEGIFARGDELAQERLAKQAEEEARAAKRAELLAAIGGGSGSGSTAGVTEADNEALQRQDQLLQQIIGTRETFKQQVIDTEALLQQGRINEEERNLFFLEQNAQLLEGTIAGEELKRAQYQQTYDQLAVLREQNIIDEKSYQEAVKKVENDSYLTRQQQAESFFGTLAELSKSGNRKIAKIGQAAALFQAIVQGRGAVIQALNSAPAPISFALAGATAAVVAANVAQIAGQVIGFQNGGSFQVGGAGGVDQNLLSLNGEPVARVSRGETVNVARGDRSGGGGRTIQIINNIQTQDAESFQRSEDQIGRRMARQLRTADQRNG